MKYSESPRIALAQDALAAGELQAAHAARQVLALVRLEGREQIDARQERELLGEVELRGRLLGLVGDLGLIDRARRVRVLEPRPLRRVPDARPDLTIGQVVARVVVDPVAQAVDDAVVAER